RAEAVEQAPLSRDQRWPQRVSRGALRVPSSALFLDRTPQRVARRGRRERRTGTGRGFAPARPDRPPRRVQRRSQTPRHRQVQCDLVEAGQSTGPPLVQVRIAECDVKTTAISSIGQDAQWKQLMCQSVELDGELLLAQQLGTQLDGARS